MGSHWQAMSEKSRKMWETDGQLLLPHFQIILQLFPERCNQPLFIDKQIQRIIDISNNDIRKSVRMRPLAL